jgi:hypothetical protein
VSFVGCLGDWGNLEEISKKETLNLFSIFRDRHIEETWLDHIVEKAESGIMLICPCKLGHQKFL